MSGTWHRLSHVLTIASALGVVSAPTAAQLPATAPSSAVLDDSGTVVTTVALPMRWRRLVPGSGPDNVVSGNTLVNVRLATASWLGRHARIYMALERDKAVDVRATWTAGGLLLPGSVAGGDRALVFSGIVRDPSLGGTLTMTLSADGRQLTTPIALNFQFQIEAER